MKKSRLLIVLVVILVSLLCFTTSCDTSPADKLAGKAWRLQTPDPISMNEIIEFDENGYFSLMQTNHESGASMVISGEYELTGNNLTLYLDESRTVIFYLVWHNEYRFSVSSSGMTDVYALENSSEDVGTQNLY